jgi:hypothetical protein
MDLLALINCAPARAETKLSWVGSKLRSAWNEVGESVPVDANWIGTSTACPGMPKAAPPDRATEPPGTKDLARGLVDAGGVFGASGLHADSATPGVGGRGRSKGGANSLKTAGFFDITEFGCSVHAEMEALLACARSGRSARGAILYTTTFVCHNCTRHIIAAGISKGDLQRAVRKEQGIRPSPRRDLRGQGRASTTAAVREPLPPRG